MRRPRLRLRWASDIFKGSKFQGFNVSKFQRFKMMRDEELIQNFEADALPGNGFHHADHVRLAFAYLCECPPLEALAKFSAGLLV